MLEDKAIEVGRLIGQSPEYLAVKRANEALAADQEAVALLQKLEQLRVDAQRAIAAQDNFDKVMLRVNGWILDGIKRGAASPIITLG